MSFDNEEQQKAKKMPQKTFSTSVMWGPIPKDEHVPYSCPLQ